MSQTGGYPDLADIFIYLQSQGIEPCTESNPNWWQEFWQLVYRLLKRTEYAAVLSVYCPSPTTFNVVGGNYSYSGTIKTYTPGAAIDPTNNDTTYIWMTASNTIGSAVDGTGWPTAAHVKLAEIDVSSAGIITAIRDMRTIAVTVTPAA